MKMRTYKTGSQPAQPFSPFEPQGKNFEGLFLVFVGVQKNGLEVVTRVTPKNGGYRPRRL
jgi:hypothetical protein